MTDDNRKLIAAVAKPGEPLVILWGDGDEPVSDIEKAMLKIGVQPESVQAFVQHTAYATAKRASRMKCDEATLKAADKLRVETHAAGFGDEVFVGLITGDYALTTFAGHKFDGQLVTKSGKNRHAGTGRFAPADVKTTKADGILWTHAPHGVTHPTLANA